MRTQRQEDYTLPCTFGTTTVGTLHKALTDKLTSNSKHRLSHLNSKQPDVVAIPVPGRRRWAEAEVSFRPPKKEKQNQPTNLSE